MSKRRPRYVTDRDINEHTVICLIAMAAILSIPILSVLLGGPG